MIISPSRLTLLSVAITLIVTGCGGGGNSSRTTYFRVLPGNGAGATAVSGDGHVATGSTAFASLVGQGIAWRDGTSFQVGNAQEANFASGLAVNADGTVIVGTAKSTSNPGTSTGIVPFCWSQAGGGQVLPTPAAISAFANGVSGDGTIIVGRYSPESGSPTEAVRWTNEILSVLPRLTADDNAIATAVSSDGMVTIGASGASAVRWVGTAAPEALTPDGQEGQALDASRDGSVIVGYVSSTLGGLRQAFRWSTTSGLTALGTLPGFSQSTAVAVDDSGTIVVGNSYEATGPAATEPFIWTPSTGMRKLRDVLAGNRYAALRALPSLAVRDISKDGKTIVGTSYSDSSNTYTAWSAKLP